VEVKLFKRNHKLKTGSFQLFSSHSEFLIQRKYIMEQFNNFISNINT